jgi:4-hydroxybenzoyl-CoA thioesterase
MSEDTTREFSAERVVRFGDCDPGGIVFYPRYFEMVNGVIEEWWAHVGMSWTEMIDVRRIGTPVSHVETVFLRPSRIGDRLQFFLSLEALGRSSVRFRHRVLGPAGEERIRIRQRMVCVSLDSKVPIAWPPDMRSLLATWEPARQHQAKSEHDDRTADGDRLASPGASTPSAAAASNRFSPT